MQTIFIIMIFYSANNLFFNKSCELLGFPHNMNRSNISRSSLNSSLRKRMPFFNNVLTVLSETPQSLAVS